MSHDGALDRDVAIRVMGWQDCPQFGWMDNALPADPGGTWSPSSWAADDFGVLRTVRRKWDSSQRGDHTVALHAILRRRAEETTGWPTEDAWETGGVCLMTQYYQPGDYARAAIQVLDEKGEVK